MEAQPEGLPRGLPAKGAVKRRQAALTGKGGCYPEKTCEQADVRECGFCVGGGGGKVGWGLSPLPCQC